MLFLVMMLLTTGCIETIDFDVQRTGHKLAVDGDITNTNGPYQVRLSRTSSREKVSDPLSDANVTIEDDLGNDERFYETEPGLYESMGLQVKGVADRSYTLEIEAFGRTYRSEPEVMPAAVADDSNLL